MSFSGHVKSRTCAGGLGHVAPTYCQGELVSPSYKEGSALEIPPVHIRNDMALISSCSPCHRHMSLNSCPDMCRGSWDALGPLWDMCRGGLGPSWEHLGGFVDASGPAWLHFVAFLTRLGGINDLTRTCAGCLLILLTKKIEPDLFFGSSLGPNL